MLEALTIEVEVLSRTNPVLMIFEDVHWIDPTSLEALGRTVEQLKTLAGAAGRYVPTGVPNAVDWAASRHCSHTQPARRPRNRCHNRFGKRQQDAYRKALGMTLSSALTAFLCL